MDYQKKCSDCAYYKKIAGKLNQFRCTWNNMVYKSNSICFGFKELSKTTKGIEK